MELEPQGAPGDVSFSSVYRVIHAAIERIQSAAGLFEACEAAAQEIKRLTGYDRVMIYRFDRAWNGEVIAEAREPDIDLTSGCAIRPPTSRRRRGSSTSGAGSASSRTSTTGRRTSSLRRTSPSISASPC
ncbi:hypothetical protein WMF28_32800 [Sorangium sp. So ce590]|uniref:hypothetical protein n=1 Tax=Sorangium sp. So ce590 TaxID=3133317 RepID=UPI003F5E80E3